MEMIKSFFIIVVVVSTFIFLEKSLFSFGNKEFGYVKVGDISSSIGSNHEVPPGGISVLDFEKRVPEDMVITSVKFYTNAANNKVRLKVWRLKGIKYEVVAKSNLLSITQGTNHFDLSNIRAKKGDYLGIFMESNEIDRSSIHRFKGRVYVVGDNDEIPKNTVYKDSLSGYTFIINGLVTRGNR